MLNLVREIGPLPDMIATAVATERSELLKLVNFPLTLKDTKQVLDALGIFIDSNRAQNLTILELRARLKGTQDLLTEKAKVIRSIAYQLEQSSNNKEI